MTDREPDFSGVARVWEMIRAEDDQIPAHEASIKAYIVNGPYHPLWSWWMVACVSLRDIPGVPPASKHYLDAEYEINFVTIDPEGPVPDPDKPFPQDIQYLEPVDLAYQFHGVTEEQASEIITLVARVIAGGRSCDSDYRKDWERSLRATVDHYRRHIH